jgi:hypothetical protein
MMKPARLLVAILYVAFLFLSSTFLLFVIFELSPGLRAMVRLEWIRGYALRDRFVPDPVLVFERRNSNFTSESETRGDLYSPVYGIEVSPIRFVASYGEDGFRRNSSIPPYDVLIIGDSYIEFGETDDNTLSERLKQTTGLATCNLGRSWYGPHQYVELLRRYAPQMKPRFALFCYFDGNDFRDIQEYEAWAEGGDYYDFGAARRNFLSRYGYALVDFGSVVENWIRYRRIQLMNAIRHDEGRIHPDLGVFRLGSQMIPMRIAYWPQQLSARGLPRTRSWKTLRGLLSEFRAESVRHDVTPVLVFLPTKFQIYAELASSCSGARFLEELAARGDFRSSSHDAFSRLAEDLELPLIDLAPEFEKRAARGELLYYPFDTHWNSAGRQAAAEYIAIRLAWCQEKLS